MPIYTALRQVAKPTGGEAGIGEVFEMTEDQAKVRVGLVKLVVVADEMKKEKKTPAPVKKKAVAKKKAAPKKKISLKKKKAGRK